MKSFAKFAAKIPNNYLPKIEQSITRAVEVLSDPNASSDAYDAVAKELADIQRTVGKDAAKAWKGEVAERLKTSWIEAGRDGIAMERQVAPKITRILESSEKLRAAVVLREGGCRESGTWTRRGKHSDRGDRRSRKEFRQRREPSYSTGDSGRGPSRGRSASRAASEHGRGNHGICPGT